MFNNKWLFSIIFFFLFFTNNIAYASSSDEETAGGFTIEGISNNNQIDKSVNYFYLHEDPGSKDEIKLKLSNSSDKEKILKIKVVDANTNSNGIVDYTGELINNNILKDPLTKILNPTNKEEIVPANSTLETNLKISMPSQRLKGVIVGGVTVTERQKNRDNKEGKVSNDYSYTIGIVLTNEEKVDLFKNISVELENVKPELFAGKKVIQANILNPNPYIFSKAEVKGAVYNEDGKTKIKENHLNNVSIAPYSALPFQIDWQKDDLKPGTYIFKGSVKTEENTWYFEKKFEIKNTEAKKINKESVFKVVLPIWFIYSGYVVILINIMGSFYIIIRKLKKHKLNIGGK